MAAARKQTDTLIPELCMIGLTPQQANRFVAVARRRIRQAAACIDPGALATLERAEQAAALLQCLDVHGLATSLGISDAAAQSGTGTLLPEILAELDPDPVHH